LCCIGYIVPFRNDKWFGYFILTILGIFLSSGYMCGTDWPNYEKMYEAASYTSLDVFAKEKGYFIYMLLFKYIGIDFWSFIIITKIIVFVLLINFLNGFEIKKSGFLFLFLAEIGFMLFIDNPLRNFIAFGISLLAVKSIIRNNIWSFILLSLLAISFHFSAIILIAFYFVRKIHFSNDFILILYFVAFLLCFNFDFKNLQYLIPAELYTSRVETYIENTQFIRSSFYSGFIYRTATLLFLLYYREEIIKKKNGLLVFNMSVIFFLIYPLGMAFVILQRFQYYSFPFVFIALLYAISCVNKIIIKEIIILLFITYSFVKLNMTLTQDSRYIPYTNYFYYEITDTKPYFKTRVMYNERNSPYDKPKGSWE
jgi:hypothetical protein